MSIHLTRIYTRSGDGGNTSLTTGERVSKSHPRLEAYGTLDELGAFLGRLSVQCAQESNPEALRKSIDQLRRIQSNLFDMGTLLATPEGGQWPGMPRLSAAAITQLETWIDAMNENIPALTSFVLAGGSAANAEAHICRTVCRRLERLLVHLQETGIAVDPLLLGYINRLSDYLFVFSRWAAQLTGDPEVLWEPNREDAGTA